VSKREIIDAILALTKSIESVSSDDYPPMPGSKAAKDISVWSDQITEWSKKL